MQKYSELFVCHSERSEEPPYWLLLLPVLDNQEKMFRLAGFGGLLDGVEDAHVTGAAAEIPGEAFLNLVQGWLWILIEQVVSGEDHAGSADAALRAAAFEEALLNGVELLVRGDAFDSGELMHRTVHFDGGDGGAFQ